MIISNKLKKEQIQERLNLKSAEQAFTHQIVNGTNCSSFESEVIVEKAKEIFALGEYAEGRVLQDGQIVFIAVDSAAPPGVPISTTARALTISRDGSRHLSGRDGENNGAQEGDE